MKQNSFNIMISQLNMGFKQRRSFVFCPMSLKNVMFLKLLMEEGFILGYYNSYNNKSQICVFIKYWENKPLISQITSIKRSDKNVYLPFRKLNGDLKSRGIFVISSSVGGFFLNNQLQSVCNIRAGGKVIAKIDV